MASNYGIKLWHQTMASNYGIKPWHQTMASNYGIKLWYQNMLQCIQPQEDMCTEDRHGFKAVIADRKFETEYFLQDDHYEKQNYR